MISKSQLRQLFDYREDGHLIWKESQRGPAKSGDLVGYSRPDGYRVTKIKGRRYLVHRLIYAWHHGEWPPLIDHQDTNPSNNRIGNLRPLSQTDNHHNTNKVWGAVPYRGVCKRKNLFRARIQYEGKETVIGYFITAEEARDKLLEYKKERNIGY